VLDIQQYTGICKDDIDATVVLHGNILNECRFERHFQEWRICGGMKYAIFIKAQLTVKRCQPKAAVEIFFEEEDLIIGHAVERRKLFEFDTVVARYSFICGYPQKIVAVAIEEVNRICRQPIFLSKVEHWHLLGKRPLTKKKTNKGCKKTQQRPIHGSNHCSLKIPGAAGIFAC
jgi:hypothetical protein